MLPKEIEIVDKLIKFSAAGGFLAMATAGWLLCFDVSALASLLTASNSELLVNLFIGGGMLKGGVFGLVFGLATRGGRRADAEGAASSQISPGDEAILA